MTRSVGHRSPDSRRIRGSGDRQFFMSTAYLSRSQVAIAIQSDVISRFVRRSVGVLNVNSHDFFGVGDGLRWTPHGDF